ncbi:hypothetical protein [Erythrobacter sp. EC-HK427]|uniref:hypothetical protein n=1 Tax=Erythrobacter sp. EC-HK427 TaxID=2038396 RepID=UPI00125FAD44|nr:hypothetical protein [Erythrobacter sp. EC-HK427]
MAAQPAPPLERNHPLLDFAPYLHKAPRKNSITPTKQRRFVAELAATGIVSHAAMKIGVSMEALYKLRNRPGAEGFKAAWDAAVDMGIDRLEAGALARATDGTEVWRYDPGGQYWFSDGERKHNENLVMFFLRNRRPEKYAAQLRPGHPVYERIRREVLGDLVTQAQRNEAGLLEKLAEEIAGLGKGEG